MRWINHQTTTALLVYAGTGNLSAATVATIGSVLPDAMEFPLRGFAKHRGLSHYPYLYGAAAASAWYVWWFGANLLAYYIFMMLLGALIHLLEDAMSPRGIHWGLPSGKRRGLGLYQPFAPSEYLVAMALVIASVLYCVSAGYLNVEYLVNEVERIRLVSEYFARQLI